MRNTTRTWSYRLFRRGRTRQAELHGYTQQALDEEMLAAFSKGYDSRSEISLWARAAFEDGDDNEWQRTILLEIKDTTAAADFAEDFTLESTITREGLAELIAFTELYGRWVNLSAPMQATADLISQRMWIQSHFPQRIDPPGSVPVHVESPTATARRFAEIREQNPTWDPLLYTMSGMRRADLAEIGEQLEESERQQGTPRQPVEPDPVDDGPILPVSSKSRGRVRVAQADSPGRSSTGPVTSPDPPTSTNLNR